MVVCVVVDVDERHVERFARPNVRCGQRPIRTIHTRLAIHTRLDRPGRVAHSLLVPQHRRRCGCRHGGRCSAVITEQLEASRAERRDECRHRCLATARAKLQKLEGLAVLVEIPTRFTPVVVILVVDVVQGGVVTVGARATARAVLGVTTARAILGIARRFVAVATMPRTRTVGVRAALLALSALSLVQRVGEQLEASLACVVELEGLQIASQSVLIPVGRSGDLALSVTVVLSVSESDERSTASRPARSAHRARVQHLEEDTMCERVRGQ